MKKTLLLILAGCLLLAGCKKDDGYELVDVSEESVQQEIKTQTELVEKDYPRKEETDDSLKPGEEKIEKPGEKGLSKITYEITYENGKEVSRRAISEEIVKKPVEELVKVGPKAEESSKEEEKPSTNTNTPSKPKPQPSPSRPNRPNRRPYTPPKPTPTPEPQVPQESSTAPAPLPEPEPVPQESELPPASNPDDIIVSPNSPSASSEDTPGDITVEE